MKPIKQIYFIAAFAWAIAMIVNLNTGPIQEINLDLILALRLPRALLSSGVGIGLAVAGTALQALFTNPLCEPYTLGISSGSALGAVIGLSLGFEAVFAGLAGSAFLGASLFSSILYLIAHRTQQGNSTLLLSGVMLGFFGSSLVALWMTLSDPNGIQGILYWLLGDLSRARLEGSLITLAGTLLLSIFIWRQSRTMDALLMGEEGALSLGISIQDTRRKIIVLSSLMVSLCVSSSGMIGFVGLVIPHIARKLVGSLHIRLVPLAAILGATTLTFSDSLARIIARPYELPVGVITALMGVPIFLWVMLQNQSRPSG